MKKTLSHKVGIIKYKVIDSFKQNKVLTCFLILFVLLGILTGIFTTIRYCKGSSLIGFNDFSLSEYLAGNLATSNLFFSRLFSSTVCILIVLVSSTTIFLIPTNFILLTYRAYLLSLNCGLIFVVNGFGGIITCFLIILPCQIIGLLILSFFCTYSIKRAVSKKQYGKTCKIFDKFLICSFLLILLNGIETFLLYIFSSKIILIL